MRGQQPDQDPFESPFAVTILPSSNKRGRRREPAAAQPPQPAAEAAPTARPAEVAPAHDPFIDAQRPTAGESPAATKPTQSTPSPVFGQPVPAFAAGATGFATPPASYGPPQPGYGPPAFEYPDAGAAAPEQTKKVRRPLVIALVVIVVLAALAALGVVAKARLTPAHRTVTIPPTLLGLPHDHSSTLDAATRTAQASLASLKGTFRNPQVAYFGRGVPALAVIAANVQTRPSASDRHQFFAGMAKKLGATITLHPVATGPFGGTMECGAANFAGTPATLCASLDSAAYVMVIAYNKKLVPAEATTRSVITAVEH